MFRNTLSRWLTVLPFSLIILFGIVFALFGVGFFLYAGEPEETSATASTEALTPTFTPGPSPATQQPTATLRPTATRRPTPAPTPTMTAEQVLEKTVQSVDWIQANAIDLLAFDYKDCPNVSYRLQAEAAILYRSTSPLTEMAYRHHIGEKDVYPPHWQTHIAEMETEMRDILSQLRRKGCGPT